MKETTENILQSQKKPEREYTDERKYYSGIRDKIKYPRELAFTFDQILNTNKFLPHIQNVKKKE